MSDEPQDVEARRRAERWRQLPKRIPPEEWIESVPEDPPPSSATPAGDPDTAWMLRYS
jgi:hypothetical protein